MSGTQYWGTAYLGNIQSFSYTATAGVTSNVSVACQKVRLMSTTDCFFVIGNSTTATTANGAYLPGLRPEYFSIRPGQQISALQVTAGGNMFIAECL